MKIKIVSASGYRYSGPHTFASPEAAIRRLRKIFRDDEIDFATDPREDGAASVEIMTKVCGNYKLVANAIID